MPVHRSILLNRPNQPASTAFETRADVLSDILRSLRLSTTLYGRSELYAPWGLRLPPRPVFGFLLLARGSAVLSVDDSELTVTLSPGDVALLPRGSGHFLRDATGRRLLARDITSHDCTGDRVPASRQPTDGPMTELLGGAFTFDEPLHNPVLAQLPPLLHLRADDVASSSWLAPTVQLLAAESHAPRPGGGLVLERLAEVLLVQALRRHSESGRCPTAGLRALADPAIGAALANIHAAPGRDWSVESLATAVGLSRSGFAARFAELVGETPLRYLTRWRVTRAGELLRDARLSVAAVAAQLGYNSEAAFHRAFKRVQGVGPGKWRRGHTG